MKTRVRLKIYLKTAISFFVLFSVVVALITAIQSSNIKSTMEESAFRAGISLTNDFHKFADEYYYQDQDISKFMFTVNDAISGFSSNMSNSNIYSSVLMLDDNKQVVTRSGNMLYRLAHSKEAAEFDSSFYIPLDKYFTNEQKKNFYLAIRSSGQDNFLPTTSHISGYLNDMEQLVPQKITFYSGVSKSKAFTFDFDNKPNKGDTLYELKSASISLLAFGFGAENKFPSIKDRKRLEECDKLAIRQVEIAQGKFTAQKIKGDVVRFDEVVEVSLESKNYYLAYAVQGFPTQIAISQLMPLYIFLFLFMGAMFFIISRSFVKTYNKQLELESSRRDLTNAIAHELKTPLGIIRSYSEGLLENINQDKKEHYLNVIIGETEHMDAMVLDMLTLSQLDSCNEKLNLIDCSLKDMVEDVLIRFNKQIADKNIHLSLRVSDENSILCDREKIEQVISNFLSNAIRHTDFGGEIAITVDEVDKMHQFSIENSGETIPEEKLECIWDLFYKVDSARSRSGGTGLGLSIVKNILVLHGFEYGVENTQTGVKFWFKA